MPRVQILRNRIFVDVKMVQAAVAGGGVHDRAKCIHQFGACAVIERQGQHHAGIARGRIPRPCHLFLHRRREFMLPSDVFQPDIVLVEGGNFRLQIAAEQAHQEIDFAAGTLLPVLFRKRVQGQPGIPMRAAVSTVERTDVTPARCPAMRGKWRRCAQRPLPSMMMAMCFGSRSGSSRW